MKEPTNNKQASIKPWVKDLIVRLLTLALEMIDKYLKTDDEKAQVFNVIATAFTAKAFALGAPSLIKRELARISDEEKKANDFLESFTN